MQVQTRGSGSVLSCGKHLKVTGIQQYLDMLCLVCSVVTVGYDK